MKKIKILISLFIVIKITFPVISQIPTIYLIDREISEVEYYKNEKLKFKLLYEKQDNNIIISLENKKESYKSEELFFYENKITQIIFNKDYSKKSQTTFIYNNQNKLIKKISEKFDIEKKDFIYNNSVEYIYNNNLLIEKHFDGMKDEYFYENEKLIKITRTLKDESIKIVNRKYINNHDYIETPSLDLWTPMDKKNHEENEIDKKIIKTDKYFLKMNNGELQEYETYIEIWSNNRLIEYIISRPTANSNRSEIKYVIKY